MRVAILIVKPSIILVSALFMLIKINNFVNSSEKINFYFSDGFSERYKGEIENFFEQNYNLSLNNLAKKFFEHFDNIAKLNLKRDGKLKVFVKPFLPLINFNNKLVIIENKKFIDIYKFDQSYYSQIPYIYSKKDMNFNLLNFIFNFPLKYFDKYDLEIESDSQIWLRSKRYNLFSVLTYSKFIPSEEILKTLKRIFKEKLNNCKKDKKLTGDIRFKGQIVFFEN